MPSLRHSHVTALVTLLAITATLTFTPAAARIGNRDQIKAEDMKAWLTYLSSDEFEGRATYTEGLGLAAGHIAGQLKSWGVKPGGGNGSYFQRVAVLGIKSSNRSTVTVEANGLEAIATIGPVLPPRGGPGGQGGRPNGVLDLDRDGAEGRERGQGQGAAAALPEPDFTTAQRLDAAMPPNVSAQDEVFEFLLGGETMKYADLKEKALKGEPLPGFSLKNVRITFNIDADYQTVRTQYTRNVIGVVEGGDPKLKDTYVAFGAHYDHVGYAEGDVTDSANGPRRMGARGRVTEGAILDRIWNGADDDGSGTVAMLGIAKAFAAVSKPRRSLLFIWHSGEERGLLGSRYYADYPTISIDKIVAQVNMDMVGRNRNNRSEEANTIYVVGSDRISSEFHNITVEANAALGKPLTLDYEMNDPTDLEQIYYRSDHYSYAAKGIPIVFLTTGLHPDYHANTDSAEKINYEKMARIAQYAYLIGVRAANLDHPPARDNRGPRVGKGSAGKIAL